MRYGPIKLRSEVGEGEIILDVYEEDGRMICGIFHLAAKFISTGNWLTTIRNEMRKIEQISRDAGCVEMRLSGRDWSRCFPEYEYLMGVKNGLRKEL